MVNEKRLLEEFLELVQIDSETKHEAEISKVLKQKFTDLGLSVKEDDTKEVTGHGAGNLICTLKGTKMRIRFISHRTWTRLSRAKALSRLWKTAM